MPGDRLETMVRSMMVLPECMWSTSVRINLVFASASRDASAAAIRRSHLATAAAPSAAAAAAGKARARRGRVEGESEACPAAMRKQECVELRTNARPTAARARKICDIFGQISNIFEISHIFDVRSFDRMPQARRDPDAAP